MRVLTGICLLLLFGCELLVIRSLLLAACPFATQHRAVGKCTQNNSGKWTTTSCLQKMHRISAENGRRNVGNAYPSRLPSLVAPLLSPSPLLGKKPPGPSCNPSTTPSVRHAPRKRTKTTLGTLGTWHRVGAGTGLQVAAAGKQARVLTSNPSTCRAAPALTSS